MLGSHQEGASVYSILTKLFIPSFKGTTTWIIQTGNPVKSYSDGFLYLIYALF